MQLCSEEFNLSVKRLSRGISGTIDEIVEYFSLSISNGCGNSTEILVPKVLHYLSSLYMFHILFTFPVISLRSQRGSSTSRFSP